jgi:septal ring factor EnvC (AmiA/AmiB activator)
MRHGKEYCSSHYIRLDQLTAVVLADIRHHARYAKDFRSRYMDCLKQMTAESELEDLKKANKDMEKAQKRITALDDIIKKLLEQNALGGISNERFYTLSSEYEAEQNALKAQLAQTKERITKARESEENIERFAELIDKYVDLRELNAPILNELIEEIVVHQRETVDGQMTQQVDIYYKFIGMANIYI